MAHIVVVDDDVDMVQMMKLTLEVHGYTVAAAYSKKEGMEIIHRERPDLIIQDIMMAEPDDGITMVQDLRREGFAKPIIMLSSISEVTGFTYDTDSDLIPCDLFLHKPVKPELLVEKVTELLAKGGV